MTRYTGAVESIKIALECTMAAVLYGVIHDQITARICLEYFTVFHPPMFATQSPTLQGLGWGIIATWWAGAIIGVLLRTAARSGSRNKMTARQLVPYVACLMTIMAVCAALFGTIGYFWGSAPQYIADSLPDALQRRFLADWWAHAASYGSGLIGGLVLCLVVLLKRYRGPEAAKAS